MSWGVVVRLYEGGKPAERMALFEGWYMTRVEAQEVFTSLCEEFPKAQVSLIKRDAWRDAT